MGIKQHSRMQRAH